MASSRALGRALSRAGTHRIGGGPVAQRRNASSSFTVHIPKAETPAKTGRSPRWQPQQRFTPAEHSASSGGRLLLEAAKRFAGPSPLVDDLAKAVEKEDLEAAWTAFDGLHKAGETARISGKQHGGLLKLCIGQRAKVKDGTLDKQWHERFVLIAEKASLTGDVRVIFGWLRLLLGLNQPEQVIRIWHKLVASTIAAQRKASAPRPPAKFADQRAAATPVALQPRPFMTFGIGTNGYQVDVHDIACLVVIACYKVNRPGEIVACFEQLELGNPFRVYFAHRTARRILKDVIHSAGDAEYGDWAELKQLFWQADLARGASSGSGGPQRLDRLLGSLFQMRRLEAAEAMFDAAMAASSGPDAWLAVQGAPSPPGVPAKRVQWTDSCWAICLSELIALNATDMAKKVWSHYHDKQLAPSPRVWNALLDGYAQAKKFDAVSATWAQIMKQPSNDGTFPDVQMYTTMINALFRRRRSNDAMALFAELMKRGTAQGGKLQVGAETYNAVMHGLMFNNQHEDAQRLLAQMRAAGPGPNIGTVNTFLRAHGRVGDLTALAATLRTISELQLKPDVVTFTTVLDALLRKGGSGESAQDTVRKVLRIMDTFEVRPNAVTYTAMIKASLNGADAANMDAVTQSLSVGPKPTNAEPGEASMEAALVLLDRMIEARVAPTEVTYTVLIGGCMQHPDAVTYAFRSTPLPRRFTGLPAPMARLDETRETMQAWSQQAPHLALALLLTDQLKQRQLPMTTPAYHYLIEGLCGAGADRVAYLRALDLMDDMLLRSSPLPNANTSRGPGPMLASVLTPDAPAAGANDVYTLNHTSWVVVLTSLLTRAEQVRSSADRADVLPALSTAVRLIWATGSLSGAEGGLTLTRLVDRATSLFGKRI